MLKAVRPIVVVLGLMSGAAIYPAVAQEEAALTAVPEIEVVTEADVVAACTSEGASEDACLAALEAYAAYLESTGIDPAAFEQAMVDLVVAMGETELPESVREIVAAAVEEISTTYVTDPELKVALNDVAAAIEAGEENPTASVSSPA